MPRYFAFLRAINVGGHVVKMDALRDLFTGLGLSSVETFIASGNVVFESRAQSSALERKIEAALQAELGYPVATFLRTGQELAAVHRYRAFDAAQVEAARAHCVGFMARGLTAAERDTLMSLQTEDDSLHVNGREIYWLARKGQGQSVISNALLERKLKLPITMRSVTTITKMAAKYRVC
jgi:uncharacterized protein (DUF1697 family)